jgi:hypothetical protein
MKEKINYYAIKTIAVVILLFCLSQIFLTIYLFGTTEMGAVAKLLYPAHSDLFSGLIFVFLLFGIDWIIGFFGSLGLFFFKKIGYYLTILAILFYWLISFMQGGGPMMHWQVLIIATPILIYLLFQKKNTENFHNLNPSQGRKAVAILSVIFTIALLGSLVWLRMNVSSLQEQGKFPTVQTQTTAEGDKIEVVNSDIGQTVKAPLSVPVSSVTAKASEVAGFRIYCPSFIPKEFKKDMTIAHIMSTKTMADCSLQDSMPSASSPEIMILERPIIQGEENTILKAADSLSPKQNVDINGDKGFTGTRTTDTTINVVIYTTKENTAVQIQSKNFNLDLLLKVARSMQ